VTFTTHISAECWQCPELQSFFKLSTIGYLQTIAHYYYEYDHQRHNQFHHCSVFNKILFLKLPRAR